MTDFEQTKGMAVYTCGKVDSVQLSVHFSSVGSRLYCEMALVNLYVFVYVLRRVYVCVCQCENINPRLHGCLFGVQL